MPCRISPRVIFFFSSMHSYVKVFRNCLKQIKNVPPAFGQTIKGSLLDRLQDQGAAQQDEHVHQDSGAGREPAVHDHGAEE